MTLHVHTARFRCADPDALDVTRMGTWLAAKAGRPCVGEPFAPSWELLKAAKRGDLAEGAYEPLYLAEMRASYRRHRTAWDALLAGRLHDVDPGRQRDRVVVKCYCRDRDECHRGLLAGRILPAFGAVDEGELR